MVESNLSFAIMGRGYSDSYKIFRKFSASQSFIGAIFFSTDLGIGGEGWETSEEHPA